MPRLCQLKGKLHGPYGVAHVPQCRRGFSDLDFPCHGESRAVFHRPAAKKLLDDLRTCELWAREQSKGGEIIYFGSSFGGYTVLGHLCTREHEGRLALLRSAAVNMDRVFDPLWRISK